MTRLLIPMVLLIFLTSFIMGVAFRKAWPEIHPGHILFLIGLIIFMNGSFLVGYGLAWHHDREISNGEPSEQQ